MLYKIIPALNVQISNYFEHQFELAEQITDGKGKKQPKVYCEKGQLENIDLGNPNGVNYWRKTGPVTSVKSLGAVSCLDDFTFTYPLVLIGAVPLEKLNKDDSYSKDAMITTIIKNLTLVDLKPTLLAKKVEVITSDYETDSEKVLKQEYSNVDNINYNLAYFSLTVTVEVLIREDCIETDCAPVELPGCPECPELPVTDFEADNLTPTTEDLVTFTDLTSNYIPTDWCWDFGDGGSSLLQNPTHTYLIAGTYGVKLMAANAASEGDLELKSNYITVSNPPLDPDTVALLARMVVQPDLARRTLINDFIVGVKTDEGILNLSDSFDTIWFMSAHTQQAGRLNWVKNAHDLIEVNAPIWTLDRGYTGNASNMYLRSDYVESTQAVAVTLNDMSCGVYCLNNLSTASAEMGVRNLSDTSFTYVITNFPAVGAAIRNHTLQATTFVGAAVPTSKGLTVSMRVNATQASLVKDGVTLNTLTRASLSLQDLEYYLLANNSAGSASLFTDKQVAFGFNGKGSINQAAFFARVNTFLTAIGAV